MRSWSINLFRIRGIQLALHGSFLLLLVFVGWSGWQEAGTPGLWWNVLTIVGFFTCVVLHELGHSLTALRYGIGVRRILLMPIGGMAEFESIPRRPSHELIITVAGPAVNFVIAGLLWFALQGAPEVFALHSPWGFALQLYYANLFMGLFNLLPAFPMDGGRILRAVLAMNLPYLKATGIAARIGQAICALGVLFALFGHALGIGWFERPAWLLAALFVFIFYAGETEYRHVKWREQEEAHWRNFMIRRALAGAPGSGPVMPLTIDQPDSHERP